MGWGWRRRALRVAAVGVSRPGLALAVIGAMALGGCVLDGQPTFSVAQPRGATVAFDSIDGPPQAQFNALVQKLNDEAQTRQLAVISRESFAAYRVRGYMAAKVVKGQTTVAWVWDVFDAEENRALRITGEETAKSHPQDPWTVADDAMLRRIAHTSMDQLAAFLTSPDVVPVAEAAPKVTLVGGGDDPSPEAAGIFRIFRPKADPVKAETVQPAADDSTVPLPRRRPAPVPTVMSSRDTLTVAAVGP